MIEYVHSPRLHIALVLGDAFDINADAALIGRNRQLVRRIEAHGCKFTGLENLWPSRELRYCYSATLPWQHIYSVDYSPRNRPSSSMHAQTLSWHISHALLATRSQRPNSMLVVPFSWRSPEMIAAATIAGLLYVYMAKKLPNRFTICATNDLSAFEYWLDNHSAFHKMITKWQLQPPCGSWDRPFTRRGLVLPP